MRFANPFKKERPEDPPPKPAPEAPAPQPRRPNVPNVKDMPAQDLADVMSGLLGASIAARRALDAATGELAKIYWADPILRTLPLPAFGISEMTVRLKLAVARSQPPAKGATQKTLFVIVDAASLEQLPEHLVSEMEIKLSPQSLQVYGAEGQEAIVRGG